ncbi:hypothetical protein Tcan_18901 [Toxocara canis]|uniref:Uncharacterized protein n=1 Tax=Toxocara canis TaxID=6265 RepID=A0A0B2VV28_TOXCA|nr:hypothetical protein Tcan_18901 [Toxocara canis]
MYALLSSAQRHRTEQQISHFIPMMRLRRSTRAKPPKQKKSESVFDLGSLNRALKNTSLHNNGFVLIASLFFSRKFNRPQFFYENKTYEITP